MARCTMSTLTSASSWNGTNKPYVVLAYASPSFSFSEWTSCLQEYLSVGFGRSGAVELNEPEGGPENAVTWPLFLHFGKD